MKCHKHYDMDAVSTCVNCGKALCPQCSEKYNFPICDSCNLERIKNERALLTKNSILMIALFIVGLIWSLNSSNGFFSSLFMGYLFAGIPWGWSFLNRITPNIFLFMPLVGWLFYFIIKFVLALMVGMFVTPFKIYMVVAGLKRAKENEQYTKAG